MAALQALALGTAIGAVFALARQPVPAPPTLAGIMGIVGLWAGYSLLARLLGT